MTLLINVQQKYSEKLSWVTKNVSVWGHKVSLIETHSWLYSGDECKNSHTPRATQSQKSILQQVAYFGPTYSAVSSSVVTFLARCAVIITLQRKFEKCMDLDILILFT